ncbi:MAG: Restriction of telomere capping protein 5 [Alyxoria varia]|nr:MAG: Restriction of telomere capping protein 5 [Alyxoria varia]
MGAEQSFETKEVNPEELSHELALSFATKCYTHLELYCFKEVFRSLADEESGIRYWSEASLCRFLGLPDVLGTGPVVYQMASFLGAFPFPSQAPCIVTKENLLKVVTIMTSRYKRVLKHGNKDRLRLLYSSLSVFDRRMSESTSPPRADGHIEDQKALEDTMKGVSGFSIDDPANDDPDDEDEEDQLAMAALDSLDAIEAISLGERPNIRHSIIPTDNFRSIIELLLLIAPLDSQEGLSKHADRIADGDNLEDLRRTAGRVLAVFGVEKEPGIRYHTFKTIIHHCLPHLFNGFNNLFEHFLFQREFDLSKRRNTTHASRPSVASRPSTDSRHSISSPPQSPRRETHSSPRVSFSASFPKLDTDVSSHREPALLPDPRGDLLTLNTLSQLSFFLDPSSIFGRLHFLYSGSTHGFSMGSFESAVLSWKAPTLLLVSGTLLPDEPSDSQERNFFESLPPKRFPSSTENRTDHTTEEAEPTRFTYGAYLPIPWKPTYKEPISHPETLLFQLSPVHDVFRASEISTSHVTFTVPPNPALSGIGIGCPMPTARSGGGYAGGEDPTVMSPGGGASAKIAPLGPVSLWIDEGLGFASFTHTTTGGGSFHPSPSPLHHPSKHGPSNSFNPTQPGNTETRISLDNLEVYGLGGSSELLTRRRTLESGERSAKARREGRAGSISVGGGGASAVEADRDLLRMAGLVGWGEGMESGGSMG